MAKGQFHTQYQKGIIKRYYENKDDLSTQKLGEIVSELYLETNPAKRTRLWASAAARPGKTRRQPGARGEDHCRTERGRPGQAGGGTLLGAVIF